MSQSLTLEEIRKMQQSISLKEVAQINKTIKEYKLSVDQKHALISAYINGKKKYTRSRILYCLIVYFIIWVPLLIFIYQDFDGNKNECISSILRFFLWSLYLLFIIIFITQIISESCWRIKLYKLSDGEISSFWKRCKRRFKRFVLLFKNRSELNVHKLAELIFSGDRRTIDKRMITQEEIVVVINKMRDDIKNSTEDLNKNCNSLIEAVKKLEKKELNGD